MLHVNLSRISSRRMLKKNVQEKKFQNSNWIFSEDWFILSTISLI